MYLSGAATTLWRYFARIERATDAKRARKYKAYTDFTWDASLDAKKNINEFYRLYTELTAADPPQELPAERLNDRLLQLIPTSDALWVVHLKE